MIKLAIIDDHQVMINGLRLLFENESNIEVVWEAMNGEEALNKLADEIPDVVFTDISMPGINGVDLVKLLLQKNSSLKIIVFSMHLETEYIQEALNNGARGYVTKDAHEDTIIDCLNKVHMGEVFLANSVSNILALKYYNTSIAHETHTLTRREEEILKFIVNGKSNKMIAEELSISDKTVNAHRYNLMKKLQVPNTALLVRKAIEKNLV